MAGHAGHDRRKRGGQSLAAPLDDKYDTLFYGDFFHFGFGLADGVYHPCLGLGLFEGGRGADIGDGSTEVGGVVA